MALDWIKGFDQVMFNHIYREGNKEANLISNLGVVGPDRKIINKFAD